MHQINIQFAADKRLAPKASFIRLWANAALPISSSEIEVNIRIVDKEESESLNAEFRGKNKPTNVLSFPTHLPDDLDPDLNLIGDIAICADIVNQEAKDQGKEQNAHWAHMVIHGIYHLLGYDHENDKEAQEMESLETATMKKLGFLDPYLTKASH